MTKVFPQINHVGIYVQDLERVSSFYTAVMNLVVTDAGEAASVKTTVIFLSASPASHHQVVLVKYPDGHVPGPSTVNQLSFKLNSLAELRILHKRIVDADIAPVRPMNHGNALSIYTQDPEGNGIEIYMDLPWYVSQPFGDPLDLSLTDEEILEATERRVRSDPSFQNRSDWAAGLQKRLYEEG